MNEIAINQIVRVSTGEYSFCLDARRMEDLHFKDNFLAEPGEDGSAGQLFVGEDRIPVYHLGNRLGLGEAVVGEDAVILQLGNTGSGSGSWGLLVDRAEGPLPASPADFKEVPELVGDAQHGPIPWLVRWEEELVPGLDVERVRGGGSTAMVVAADYQTPVEDGAGAGSHGQIFSFQPPFVSLRARGVRMALSGSQVLEVVGQTPVSKVPMAPAFVTGICHWRGWAVPVVDVARWLGLTEAPYGEGCRLLICRTTTGGGLVGVPALGDIRRYSVPVEHRPWTGKLTVNPDFVLGAFEIERAAHLVPDLNAVSGYRSVLEPNSFVM